MSGGSYDYAYTRVEEMARKLRPEGGCPSLCAEPALRELFREHLWRVAKAMYAIEWNDSCDGDDRERELIMACLNITHEQAAGAIAEHKLKAIRAIIEE
jgi:hypothetical protein